MKVALILTTIHVPRVLELYRKLDPWVGMFVAGDLKTPGEAYDFCDSIPNCWSYTPDRQKELGWKCSSLIGWNTIGRRNIALLEAIKWGAELIVSVDDDNIPLDHRYFDDFVGLFEHNDPFRKHDGMMIPVPPVGFDGLKVSGSGGGWFDPGSLSFPSGSDPVCQRGFPQHVNVIGAQSRYSEVTGARIGIAQGAVLGDPDTSAVDRISRHPVVHQVSELLRAGLVSDPRETWAPLNSQNICFVRELAPCFLMVPNFARYDDIFAGLVAQRVMRETQLFVHYGKPFCWQQRNRHEPTRDLEDELWGMKNLSNFAKVLDDWKMAATPNQTVQNAVRFFYARFDSQIDALASAWLRDCDKAME